MRTIAALTLATIAAFGAVAAGLVPAAADAKKPAVYIDRVVEYKVGEGGGYGEKKAAYIVLGPPHGMGKFLGGSDVSRWAKMATSRWNSSITKWSMKPGPDFIIFENAFLEKLGDDPGKGNFELAKVEVSYDGREWHEFPYVTTREECAGLDPVYANPDTPEGRDIDPADPKTAGGDAFDLADLKVKLKAIRYVRITDLGNGAGANGTAGFDLDAIVAVHSRARKKD